MMAFADLTGLLGNALAITVLVTRVPGVSRLAPGARPILVGAVLVVALVPMGGLPPAGYLRGAVGDLSTTSVLLLLLSLVRFTRGGAVPELVTQGRTVLLALVAVAAVVFYPMALGWGSVDPYRLGYGSYALLFALLALALWGALARRSLVAAAVALAVAAWSIGYYASTNLWDYLMDPLLAGYAIVALARMGVRKVRGRPALQ